MNVNSDRIINDLINVNSSNIINGPIIDLIISIISDLC